MPPNPLELFLFFSQLQIGSAGKNMLKKCGNYHPSPPFKIFCYASEFRSYIDFCCIAMRNKKENKYWNLLTLQLQAI